MKKLLLLFLLLSSSCFAQFSPRQIVIGKGVAIPMVAEICPIQRDHLCGEYYYDKCVNPGTLQTMTWFDMSPAGNNATQSVDVYKPAVGATSINFVGGDSAGNFLAASATIRNKYNGTNYLPCTAISIVSHPVAVTRPWTYMVWENLAFSGIWMSLSYCTYSGRELGQGQAPYITRNRGVPSWNTFHTFVYVKESAAALYDCYEDSTIVGSSTTTWGSNGPTTPVFNEFIGNQCYGNNLYQYFDTVNIKAILMWDAILTADEQSQAVSYIKRRVKL